MIVVEERKKKRAQARLTFRDTKLSYSSVFLPLWFPQDFHFWRYYTACFQRNSIFSFRKVISQESNTEWCPGYSFSEPILQSQFVLPGAGATWKGADVVYLGFRLPIPPLQDALDTPRAFEKNCLTLKTKHAVDSLNNITRCNPETSILSPELDYGFIPCALW